jgi:hypothetical protein
MNRMPAWSDPALHDLAAEFFREFSRTEYALKTAGWVLPGPSGEAKPDWDRFAREAGARLLQLPQPHVRAAAEYILTNPPKKQVVTDDGLSWQESRAVDLTDGVRLLVFLRRIRNNLFHGGKFNGRWLQPERSYELIKHGLVLLRACREAEPQIQQAYDS